MGRGREETTVLEEEKVWRVGWGCKSLVSEPKLLTVKDGVHRVAEAFSWSQFSGGVTKVAEKHFLCEGRLGALGLCHLEKRRLSVDLMAALQCLKVIKETQPDFSQRCMVGG